MTKQLVFNKFLGVVLDLKETTTVVVASFLVIYRYISLKTGVVVGGVVVAMLSPSTISRNNSNDRNDSNKATKQQKQWVFNKYPGDVPVLD